MSRTSLSLRPARIVSRNGVSAARLPGPRTIIPPRADPAPWTQNMTEPLRSHADQPQFITSGRRKAGVYRIPRHGFRPLARRP